jgi:DME family drug/metabolite transporter
MKSHSMQGVLMVLGAAILWGTTGTAQSFAPPQLSSYWVGTFRLVFAGMFFFVWAVLTERRSFAPRALAALPWRGVATAAMCMTVYNLAFFAGVRASGVAVGTAIALGSGPMWAGALQAMASGRAPAASWWAGTLLATAGGALMIVGGNTVATFTAAGIGLCLLAGLSYAVYTLTTKKMVASASAGAVTGAVFVVAALLAMPVALALAGSPRLAGSDVAVVAWLGIMSTGFAYLLFSHALRRISGATGVALALGEPVTAFVLAILVVGERPGVAALVGLLTVLAGLGVVIRTELVRRDAEPGFALD